MFCSLCNYSTQGGRSSQVISYQSRLSITGCYGKRGGLYFLRLDSHIKESLAAVLAPWHASWAAMTPSLASLGYSLPGKS